ncbi:flagellar motor switch protein FliN [Alkalilimnicola ehrlichii]|uniref:Flagellar motor switch protein FliN n=1 Tax=Alkalilimnicola ehrlichii TaxID=351052 RepID=A0A3E0X1Z1_9GAMM|nr:flagellar motor switch protein FliN [Alkalilimnicola ehrlichii]RFA30725.1 flagellar motor switch protein FliN [Alkalilimnicola ehrlichii]RFA38301.1 flagellar motor switch protein FliN [Alkalilimnicola ehrlichii]
MKGDVSDNELDDLINEGGLDLDTQEEVTTAAPEEKQEEVPAAKPDMFNLFGKIPVRVTLEVASAEITLQELMEVDNSSVIALDKLAGEPLDVKVNGALFAKAEVVVMNGNYGLRVVELCGANLADLNV